MGEGEFSGTPCCLVERGFSRSFVGLFGVPSPSAWLENYPKMILVDGLLIQPQNGEDVSFRGFRFASPPGDSPLPRRGTHLGPARLPETPRLGERLTVFQKRFLKTAFSATLRNYAKRLRQSIQNFENAVTYRACSRIVIFRDRDRAHLPAGGADFFRRSSKGRTRILGAGGSG
jgi:hypothetical protein